MTLFTPNYVWPYPELTDTPNGPSEFSALASAIDASLHTTDSKLGKVPVVGVSVADISAQVPSPVTGQRASIADLEYYYDGSAWVVAPGQVAAASFRNSAISAIAGTETQVLSLTVPLDQNSAYRIDYQVVGSSSTSGDDFDMVLRFGSLAGSVYQQEVQPRTQSAYPLRFSLAYVFGTSSATTTTFIASLQRTAGTGTFTVSTGATTYMSATKLSAASRFTAI